MWGNVSKSGSSLKAHTKWDQGGENRRQRQMGGWGTVYGMRKRVGLGFLSAIVECDKEGVERGERS